MHPHPSLPPFRGKGRIRGFTLIEVLVVVLLMVIVLGMVGLKLGGNDGRAVY